MVWSKERINEMDESDFETLIKELYLAQGYDARKTKSSQDKGIDVIANAHKEEKKILIQAKHLSSNVVARTVRETAGLYKGSGATQVVLITSEGFTKNAREEGRIRDVKLVDAEELIILLNDLLDENEDFMEGVLKRPLEDFNYDERDYRNSLWLAKALQLHSPSQIASHCRVTLQTIKRWMKSIPNDLPELNFQEKEKLFRLYLIHTPWISGDHESFKEIRRSIRQSIFEKTSSEEFIPILIKKYKDDFGNSALNLPMAIRSINSEEKLDILEDYALNNDHEIQDRRAAIWLLSCLNKGSVESILINLLEIKDQSLKQTVIWALGIKGSKESTKYLIDIIKKDYPKKLKLSSVRALKQFSDRDVALDLALATQDVQDPEIKESMFNAVREIR